MKLALIILGLFFLSLTVRSRELTLRERSTVYNLNKTTQVKNFSESRIKTAELSMRDYIGFLALRKSCDSVELMLDYISEQSSDYADQSTKLNPLMLACQNGAISLNHLYISQLD